MKQCPNCRCQVEIQAAVCPYCGLTLPLYREYPTHTNTNFQRNSLSGSSRRATDTRIHTGKSVSSTHSQTSRRDVRPRNSREERLIHRDHQIIILLMIANLIIGLVQLLLQMIAL